MDSKLHDFLEKIVVGDKRFAGNLFDRFIGLDFLLEKCSHCTILDIGSNEGLVSYEFARHGSKIIHGLEKSMSMVLFSKRLFRDLPVESEFYQADLSISGNEFIKKHQSVLLDEYDIVLFLGVYHHLKNQMKENDLHELVEVLLAKTKKYFGVRTNSLPEFESLILNKNFKLVHSLPKKNTGVGLLHIYEKY